MYIVEVTRCPIAGTPGHLPHCPDPLSTHDPFDDIPPLSTQAVIYGVVVNDNLYT